ncbi:hypothetical protein PC116_g20373 [Phytophthora cactorum]|nr:hypothetical protein PC112_g16170 [Phytophthora cactorum]KAG2811663.1 hypothetical protein PC111_g15149 [Phytophthora cactorum]KAG2889798.1 hypothetical protein PC114_g17785 [Phytophthora cactorum]KAG4231352.1 hypothetical protein PC116_g20373 [Phytophthora cactorum]
MNRTREREIEATKKKSTKHQQHAQISPGEYGVELLQKTKLNMLKFVTLVNRRWRALKDLLARKPLGGNLTLMTDIQASGMRVFNTDGRYLSFAAGF